MGKEAFVLASIRKPDFEKVGGDIFCTSIKTKKGTAKDWGARYQIAIATGEITTFRFYSHFGHPLESPITALSSVEYDDSYPYDVIDIYTRLTPEQFAQIIPPEISSELGY